MQCTLLLASGASADTCKRKAHSVVDQGEEIDAIPETSFELAEGDDDNESAAGLDPVLVDIFVSEAKSHPKPWVAFW